jgi:hypothetical protein
MKFMRTKLIERLKNISEIIFVFMNVHKTYFQFVLKWGLRIALQHTNKVTTTMVLCNSRHTLRTISNSFKVGANISRAPLACVDWLRGSRE